MLNRRQIAAFLAGGGAFIGLGGAKALADQFGPGGSGGGGLVGSNQAIRSQYGMASQDSLYSFQGVPMLWGRNNNSGLSTAGDAGGTARQYAAFPFDMFQIRAVFGNFQISATALGDLLAPNPITVGCTLEDQNLVVVQALSFNGHYATCLQPGAIIASDTYNWYTNKTNMGSAMYFRTLVRISLPPTVTKTTATTGGTLAAATYYYVVTYTCGYGGEQGESGISTEVSQTTTGSTSIVTLTITPNANSAAPYEAKIYRSTSSGTEVLLDTIPAVAGQVITYVDNGSKTPGSATPPATGQQYPLGGNALAISGEGHNYPSGGGTGNDNTQTAGTGWRNNTGSAYYSAMALIGLPATTISHPVVAIYGDSIAAGNLGGTVDQGWPDQAMIAATPSIPYFHMSQTGEKAQSIAPGSSPDTFRFRRKMLANCSVAFFQYGINDLNGGSSLSTTQGYMIANWLAASKMGVFVVQSTILPQTTGTYSTPGNQSSGTYNFVARAQLNQWLRDGAPLVSTSNLTPAATGTVGALRAGQTGHPLTLSPVNFDVCAQIETNNAGTLTQDGGYWITSGAIGSSGFSGTHPPQILVTIIINSITAGIALLQPLTT